ncbi:hypothetical protein CANINC_003850 [Pichia inconspicua]|uniref:Major facilitator superfamily (MFS) profile domain-containing protein n=1 Tax=Pichia inconspicua TaxID=52247 RepID=A0A4T0WZ37_9ASCO|nr:hypothetical protein CANINC_003850 [[Candida] inconspicua]
MSNLAPLKTSEQLKDEVEKEWVPGTVFLVDVDHTLNVQHNGQTDIVLIPQPSDDPNDPLLWSKWNKEFQFFILFYWSFLTSVATNWNGPVWDIWVEYFNTTYDVLNQTAALCWCLLGVGCFILQPIAMKFGRRSVYLLATLIQGLGNVVGGVSHTTGQLYGVNVMTGFAGAPCDSLVQISTTDMFFQHQRASRISALTFSLYGGSYLGPVAAGYIVENEKFGWRWCYWFLVIFFGALLVVQIFLMQDSTFCGQRPDENEFERDMLMQVRSKETEIEVDSNEKDNHIYDIAEDSKSSSIPKERTYLQKLSPIELKYNDKRPFLKILLRPLLTLALPPIVWCGFVYGVQVMWLSLIATTQSAFLSTEPYNMSPHAVGNTNLASLIGCFFGMIWGGDLSDRFVAWMARRNHGVLEPEFRLWFLLVPAVVNSAGILLYGLGVNAGINWIGPAGFGMGFLGFGMGAGGGIILTYALDSFPTLQSESMVMILFIRNMIGMGFTFAIQPWLDANGVVTTTWLMFMLSMVFNFSCLIFIKWGKQIRIRCKDFYVKCSDPHFAL